MDWRADLRAKFKYWIGTCLSLINVFFGKGDPREHFCYAPLEMFDKKTKFTEFGASQYYDDQRQSMLHADSDMTPEVDSIIASADARAYTEFEAIKAVFAAHNVSPFPILESYCPDYHQRLLNATAEECRFFMRELYFQSVSDIYPPSVSEVNAAIDLNPQIALATVLMFWLGKNLPDLFKGAGVAIEDVQNYFSPKEPEAEPRSKRMLN